MIIKIKEVAKEKKGWSLYKLAKELGMKDQTVYSWANGRTQPSYENMDYLCTVLGCEMCEIFRPVPLVKKTNLFKSLDNEYNDIKLKLMKGKLTAKEKDQLVKRLEECNRGRLN